MGDEVGGEEEIEVEVGSEDGGMDGFEGFEGFALLEEGTGCFEIEREETIHHVVCLLFKKRRERERVQSSYMLLAQDTHTQF